MSGVTGCGGGVWELVMIVKGHKVSFDRQLQSTRNICLPSVASLTSLEKEKIRLINATTVEAFKRKLCSQLSCFLLKFTAKKEEIYVFFRAFD